MMAKIEVRKRGRPDKIEPLRRMIASLWKEHPGWTDDEIRSEIRTYLIKAVKDEHPSWDNRLIDDEVDKRLPSTYRISEFRRDELQPSSERLALSSLDSPWTVGSTASLTPSGVAHVLQIIDIRGTTVSVRRAMFISKLSELPMSLDWLDVFSALYSWEQGVIDMATGKENSEFDSSKIDDALLNLLNHNEMAMSTSNKWTDTYFPAGLNKLLATDPVMREFIRGLLEHKAKNTFGQEGTEDERIDSRTSKQKAQQGT